MFSKINVETLYDYPSSDELDFSYITTKQMTTKIILNAVNLLRKGYQVHDLMKAVYGYYKHVKELAAKLIGVTYVNEAEKLSIEDMKKIYGDNITASISSVESYNHCPYAHFLERSLQLKPRDIKKIEAYSIGDIYHEVMKDFALLLIKSNKTLVKMNFTEIEMMIQKIINEYADKIERKYFLSNKKNKYLLMKIQNALINSLKAMHYQAKHSQFKIAFVEEKFGVDAKRLKVKPLQLSTGFTMNLKGFIDRIDYAKLDDDIYLRVLDYKSGNQEIDFTKIYHRLSLQLFTYLDVVLNNSQQLFNKEAKAAGVLYFQIKNSVINALSDYTEEEIYAKHHEEYRMNGYTLGDAKVTSLFDDKIKAGDSSDIIRVGLKKDGNFNAYAKVLTQEEILALRKYTKKAIINSMEEFTSGKIPITPVKYRDYTHCKYCKFIICKFDTSLRENHYQEILKPAMIRKSLIKLSMK